jgi:hypothetical protein
VPTISTEAKQPIIVMDAGIGTQKNINWMADNDYHNIVVSRKQKTDIPADLAMAKIRENDRRTIHAVSRIAAGGEMEVICHSTAKEIKEQGIKNQFRRAL